MTKGPSAVERLCNRPKNPWVLMLNWVPLVSHLGV
jgi:hypothetical protein